jgi:hypothetical protein
MQKGPNQSVDCRRFRLLGNPFYFLGSNPERHYSALSAPLALKIQRALWQVDSRSQTSRCGRLESPSTDVGRLLKKYPKLGLFLIDDVGLKILPAKSGEILLEIIMRRHEARSTMIKCSGLPKNWRQAVRGHE